MVNIINRADAVSKAVNFYKAFVQAMNKEFGSKIYCYIPTFTQYAETEYWVGGGELDYSDTAVNAFREWLKNKFGSTEELNEKLGTTIFDIDTLEPPSTKEVLLLSESFTTQAATWSLPSR